jgi:hypothetical protein
VGGEAGAAFKGGVGAGRFRQAALLFGSCYGRRSYPHNPAAELELPRITRAEVDPFGQAETRCLLEVVYSAKLEALCVLLRKCGG